MAQEKGNVNLLKLSKKLRVTQKEYFEEIDTSRWPPRSALFADVDNLQANSSSVLGRPLPLETRTKNVSGCDGRCGDGKENNHILVLDSPQVRELRYLPDMIAFFELCSQMHPRWSCIPLPSLQIKWMKVNKDSTQKI